MAPAQRLQTDPALRHSVVSPVLSSAVTMVSGVILARVLGPAGRGLFASATLWALILSQLGDVGLSFALAYSISQSKQRACELWTFAMLVSAVVGTALALAAYSFLPHFIQPEMPRFALATALAAIPFLLASNYQLYLLLGAGHVFEHNWLRVSIVLVYAVGITVLALSQGSSIVEYCAAFLLAQVLGCAACWVVLLRRLNIRMRWPTQIKAELIFGAKTQVAALASHANLRLDQALMSVMLPTRELGYYVVAVGVANMITPVFSGLGWLTLPRVAQSASALSGGLEACRMLRLALLISAPIVIVAIFAAPLAIPVVFGAPYLPAILPTQVLLAASVFQGANGVIGNSLRGLGQPGKPAVSESVGALITCLLLFILLPRFGILGAAMVSFIAYASVAALQARYLARIIGIDTSAVLWRISARGDGKCL